MKRPVWDDRLSTGCALGMIEFAKLGEKTERDIQAA